MKFGFVGHGDGTIFIFVRFRLDKDDRDPFDFQACIGRTIKLLLL